MNNQSTKSVGDLGESLACEFLRRRGYQILSRNYRKKWGEIDVVARKSKVLHFIEVKSVKVYSFEGAGGGEYRPEENVHPQKLLRLSRAIQTYLMETKNESVDWQIDVIAVFLNETSRKARCRILENVVL